MQLYLKIELLKSALEKDWSAAPEDSFKAIGSHFKIFKSLFTCLLR